MTQQQARSRRRARWRRRWYRAVVPFLVLLVVVGVALIARVVEEPNLRASGALAPAGTGPDGSSELAQMLTEQGARIDYVSTLEEALDAVSTGEDSVVFIPRPTTFGALLAAAVPYLPGDHRLVMVAPGDRHLWLMRADLRRSGTRWATAVAEPGCGLPEATAAGRAGVRRSHYRPVMVAEPTGEVPPPGHASCYDGGLVRQEYGPDAGTELLVAGSTDPFRNKRIDEHGNAALARGLLGSHDRVIWAGALPFDPQFEMPPLSGLELPELEPPSRGERSRDSGTLANFFAGYPSPMLMALALAAAVGLLVALARARRLGAPVSEPLPVLVPAAEVVAGRGRLYQRARGRDTALEALRAAAIARMLPALGLTGGSASGSVAGPAPPPEVIVSAVATRTGLPTDFVRQTLYGPVPDSDDQLRQAVAALDLVVAALIRQGGNA